MKIRKKLSPDECQGGYSVVYIILSLIYTFKREYGFVNQQVNVSDYIQGCRILFGG
jgi:hypothetical protein